MIQPPRGGTNWNHSSRTTEGSPEGNFVGDHVEVATGVLRHIRVNGLLPRGSRRAGITTYDLPEANVLAVGLLVGTLVTGHRVGSVDETEGREREGGRLAVVRPWSGEREGKCEQRACIV
jgi:hypothetical protein